MELFPPDAALKQCTKCPNSYPATLEFFSKNTRGKLSAQCKSCDKAYRDQYYLDHKTHVLEKSAKRYEMYHDEILEHQKAYQLEHPEARRERVERYKVTRKEYDLERGRMRRQEERYQLQQKQYRQNHREENTMYSRQYRKDKGHQLNEKKREYMKTEQGKMERLAHQHKRRAQKLASGGVYTPAQIRQLLKLQRHRCYYAACGHAKFLRRKGRYVYHIDHAVPLSRGGSNDIGNLVLACPSCNLSKNNKLPHEWVEGGRLF